MVSEGKYVVVEVRDCVECRGEALRQSLPCPPVLLHPAPLPPSPLPLYLPHLVSPSSI